MHGDRRDLSGIVRFAWIIGICLLNPNVAFSQDLDVKVKPDKSLKFATAEVIADPVRSKMVKNSLTDPTDSTWRDTHARLGRMIEETLEPNFDKGSDLRVVYSFGYQMPTSRPRLRVGMMAIAVTVRFLDSADKEVANVYVSDVHPGAARELDQRLQKVAKKIGDYAKKNFRKRK